VSFDDDKAAALRGKRARDVLENEVYSEAHSLIEQEIINRWRAAQSTEERERLHLMLGLLGKVKSALESVMSTGQAAEKVLEAEKSRLQRLGARFAIGSRS
jgi:hypothetical protein